MRRRDGSIRRHRQSLEQRPTKRLLHCFLAGLLLLPQTVVPATITVDASCSLADAITSANTDASVGGCAAGSGSDEIVLTTDVTLTTIDNGFENGLPVVESDILIEGGGLTISRDPGAAEFRILDVQMPGSLVLRNTTLSGGGARTGSAIRAYAPLTIENDTITGSTGNPAISGRGYPLVVVDSLVTQGSFDGIKVTSGATETPVTIANSTISENKIGLHVFGANISLVVDNSQILDNRTIGIVAQGAGGNGTALIVETRFSGNASAIQDDGAEVTIVDSTITENIGAGHVGIVSDDHFSSTTIVGTTISGNTTTSSNNATSAIYGSYGSVRLVNSTVSGNDASYGFFGATIHGYMIYDFVIENSTITGNSGAAVVYSYASDNVEMNRSIVAGNTTTSGNCFSVFSSAGSNFDDDGSCPGASPIVGGVDFDTALADNGGPTATHALLAGSVAIDAAGACGLIEDQRGFGRDALCDSGAYELASIADGDGDGIADDDDNCPANANAGQSDIDADGVGDVCDPCPAFSDPTSCEQDGSTAEEVDLDEGGLVETPDGGLSVDIPPQAGGGTTTISVTEVAFNDPAADVSLGTGGGGFGQRITVYDLKPDGQAFDPPAVLTIEAEVGSLSQSQIDKLDLYLENASGVFEPLGAACSVAGGIASCVVEISHFSVYSMIAPLDSDGDDIWDAFDDLVDVCPEDPNLVDGLLPPMAELVPEGEAETPLPDKAFKANRTIPLKLEYSCGAVPVTGADDVSPPELEEVWLVGAAEPLEIINPEEGDDVDSGTSFRFSDSHWIYNLSTRGFEPGTYELILTVPDGRRFKTGFVLR